MQPHLSPRTFDDDLRRLLAARAAVVFIESQEEGRLERLLNNTARTFFSPPIPFYVWSITEGLMPMGGEKIPGSEDPVVALSAVIEQPGFALFHFRDLHHFYDQPRVVRRLRDVAHNLRDHYKTVFLSGGRPALPMELEKEIDVLELPLPSLDELERLFTAVANAHPKIEVQLGEKLPALIRSALGLSEEEARLAFSKLFVGVATLGPEAIEELHDEKRRIVRKEGILDFIVNRVQLDQIGGLATVKKWLTQRRRYFSVDAKEMGIDPPKGVLVTGISGCGKSMVVQAIASYWQLPLLRLDMNRIYAAVAGTPEQTLERAIAMAEAVSPCVLWIDEIETALVGTARGAGTQATRIFSSFLTWMQEKDALVFVAATANEIDQLPPELLRKGRFDQIFFVDLPSEAERLEILALQLIRHNKDPKLYDIVNIAKSTGNFNGAELAEVVQSALYDAFDEERDLERGDLYRALGKIIPLATTMAERIKQIKRWADTRAIKAGESEERN
ncbi:MAG: AAA family ATPase [Deltaproteobacteria bacterium]|nr:AAA family ATPase [Deltaproteobacteria bacterium]